MLLEGDGFELLVPRRRASDFPRGELVISVFAACLCQVTPRAHPRRIEELNHGEARFRSRPSGCAEKQREFLLRHPVT
jgi:hypothetical protein